VASAGLAPLGVASAGLAPLGVASAGLAPLGVASAGLASAAPSAAASSSTACLATLYGSPVSAIRWRVAVFLALSCVMIISSRRVGPRLPAMGEWHDLKARRGMRRD